MCRCSRLLHTLENLIVLTYLRVGLHGNVEVILVIHDLGEPRMQDLELVKQVVDLCLFLLLIKLLANVCQTLGGPFSAVPTPNFKENNSKYSFEVVGESYKIYTRLHLLNPIQKA